MSREEIAWRTRAATRTVTDRMAGRLRLSRWGRAEICSVVTDDVADLPLRAAIAAGEWSTVHDSLVQRIRARASRFVLDPASAAGLRGEVLRRWPEATTQAAEQGDAILAGRYDLLGYRALVFAGSEGAVDWHLDPIHNRRAPRRFWADVPYLDPAAGDHKIIWELNRHQHWLRLGRALWLTGDLRHARRITEELAGWLDANPPLVGTNWASTLEIGLRAISWTWGLHFLLGIEDRGSGIRAPWLVDMFVALDRQLTHVEKNLSVYFSPNTHLTGEALALYVVGVALPELAASRRWANTGRRILLEEIDRQIRADGGHVEQSTHYQRYTLDFYLMALLTASRDGDAAAVRCFTDAVSRLAEFTRTMADDAGRLPLIGDDDGGTLWPLAGRACHDVRDSLALAAALLGRPSLAPWGAQEELLWLAGTAAINDTSDGHRLQAGSCSLPSRALTDTGYVVLRDSTASHAVFDAGPHGYMNGGHAHADALAITLTLAGRPLLVDPGTSTYTMDRGLRDRLRSSMSHNTLTIDGRSQALPSGPFHWHTRADGRLHARLLSPGFDWAEASHDGYAPLRHRRTLLRTTESGWLVVDEVLGEGRHDASARWHFHPDWTLQCDAPGRLRATHVEGGEAWLLHDGGDVWMAHGDEGSGLGWYAPTYGALIQTWTAGVTQQATAPFAMITWIAGTSVQMRDPPTMERVAPVCDAGRSAIGARVVAGQRTAVFLLQPGETRSPVTGECEALDYRTDARVMHYLEAGGNLVRLDLVGASHARACRGGWLSVAAHATMADLHATIQDGVLDLEASQPPPLLSVQGDPIRGLVSVRLNHRELPRPLADRTDTLLLSGGDWGESFRVPS
jgi:uncharacterized heparinase superfamily protein